MPVSRTEGLTLSVVYPRKSEAVRDGASVRTEHVCRFSLTGWNKQPKLRQGVYFMALPECSSDALPCWDACRFVPKFDGANLTGGTLWAGTKPVPAHYLVLSVDTLRTVGVTAT